MHQQRAAQIRLTNYRNARFAFDVLSQQFGQDDLLSEKFRPDRDFRLRGLLAGKIETAHIKNGHQTDDAGRCAAHSHTTLNRRSSSPSRKSASSASTAAG